MENIFISLYRYLRSRPAILWPALVVIVAFMAFRSSHLHIEADITRIFPTDDRVKTIDDVFRNSRAAEKIVVMLSVRDSAYRPQPNQLVELASAVIDCVNVRLAPHIKNVQGPVDDSKVLEMADAVLTHLPVFITEEEYAALDSLTNPVAIREALKTNYRTLIHPAGIGAREIIMRDPLGISFLVLRRMQHLQYDENLELYDSYIVTKDHRHLIFFIQPVYPADDTQRNAVLLEELESLLARQSEPYPELSASFFGASVVAEGNARQLRKDTLLTVGIMILLLAITLLGFFRKKRVPLLILAPVIFGALFSMTCISFVQSSLSVLALAVGAVILGVAVDYGLHYLVFLKESRDPEKVIREITKPLTIGSLTTVFAFLSLRFTNAAVLQDIGLFAGFSLVGAALFTMVFLPHVAGNRIFTSFSHETRLPDALFSFATNRWLAYGILLLTPLFLYFAGDVAFNADMNKLNFMTGEVRQAGERLEQINQSSLSSAYVVAAGSSLEYALRKNEIATARLRELQKSGLINRLASTATLMISDSLQQVRLARWNAYWTEDKRARVMDVVRETGRELKFSPLLTGNADSLLSRTYAPIPSSLTKSFGENFFKDLIIEKDTAVSVIALAGVFPEDRQRFYEAVSGIPATAFDRSMLTNLFVGYVNDDFAFIVSVTSVLVFLMLLISYGRIELTLITFVPMFFTWVWILGIMAIAGIEFNVVNVMVSTFIFGLGDDYSIFTMDGLQQEYRRGVNHLGSIRTSIFLSALTTVFGLGVLVFAKHPALKSIATISIIGIVSVFVMSQILEPFFFRTLITNRTRKGLPPMTFKGILISLFVYGFFVVGSLALTLIGLLIKVLPIGRKRQRLFFHKLIQLLTGALVHSGAHVRKRIIGLDSAAFSRPAIIVSNHSSFMDILVTAMLHPKVILLTNNWVWNSPVFGGVVRLADYYPVTEGADAGVARLQERTREGYSVVVFPEGTRSSDGKIGRFHKGAFYLAESLKLPVVPLLNHGSDKTIPKGTIYVNDGAITLKFLPAIEPDDTQFGITYQERAKSIGKYFRQEFEAFRRECETPEYFHRRLISNFVYKGPVLEWYARVKVRLEDNYKIFHELVPSKGNVLDLGCGYGFLAHMLHMLEPERRITAVDYDIDKIETARNGFLKSNNLTFIHADVTKFELTKYDSIIISDVLHYLTTAEQMDVVERCFEALLPGGRLIIRDGDRDLDARHKGTWLTELFSVKLLGFNKARNELNFISGQQLRQAAKERGFEVSTHDETRYTSNVIFVISKSPEVHETV